MQKIKNALYVLGVKGKVRFAQYRNIIEITVNNEYFGLWDISKNTFVD